MTTHFLFILNEDAGTSSHKDITKYIEKQGKVNQIPSECIHIIFSSSLTMAEHLIDRFYASYDDLVLVACGGDGTVFALANLVMDKDIIFSILPLGTGNDLYRSLYQNRSHKHQLKAIFSGQSVWTDAIYCEELDLYSLNIVNIGLDAEVVAQAEKIRQAHPRLRKYSYMLGIPASLKTGLFRDYTIEASYQNQKLIIKPGPYAVGVTCNGGYYGSGFNVNPLFNVDDGKLELIYIPEVKAHRVMELIYKIFAGKIIAAPGVYHEIVDWVRYRRKSDPLLFSLDGELYELDQLTLSVAPKKYRRIK